MRSKIKLEGDLLGLDLGKKRTGVARISTIAAIAEALAELPMTDEFVSDIQNLLESYGAAALVVGLPRGLDGQNTEQTVWSEQQVEKLKATLTVPVFTIDEAGTTKAAEQRAKPGESVDSVAAGVLLEDFVRELKLGNVEA